MRLPALVSTLVVAAAVAAAPVAAAPASPEQVVRAWSKALNAGNDEAAARLFAEGARVLQGGYLLVLRARGDAVLFNSSLPCAGRIVALRASGERVQATFLLGDRPGHRCDGPGEKATAVFLVRRGKIVIWAQVPTPPDRQPAAPKKPKKPRLIA